MLRLGARGNQGSASSPSRPPPGVGRRADGLFRLLRRALLHASTAVPFRSRAARPASCWCAWPARRDRTWPPSTQAVPSRCGAPAIPSRPRPCSGAIWCCSGPPSTCSRRPGARCCGGFSPCRRPWAGWAPRPRPSLPWPSWEVICSACSRWRSPSPSRRSPSGATRPRAMASWRRPDTPCCTCRAGAVASSTRSIPPTGSGSVPRTASRPAACWCGPAPPLAGSPGTTRSPRAAASPTRDGSARAPICPSCSRPASGRWCWGARPGSGWSPACPSRSSLSSCSGRCSWPARPCPSRPPSPTIPGLALVDREAALADDPGPCAELARARRLEQVAFRQSLSSDLAACALRCDLDPRDLSRAQNSAAYLELASADRGGDRRRHELPASRRAHGGATGRPRGRRLPGRRGPGQRPGRAGLRVGPATRHLLLRAGLVAGELPGGRPLSAPAGSGPAARLFRPRRTRLAQSVRKCQYVRRLTALLGALLVAGSVRA